VAPTVFRRRRRRRRRRCRGSRTYVVGDYHHEAGVASPGCGQQRRPTAVAAATAVHVAGRAAAERRGRPASRRVGRWRHGGQGPVQVAVRRTAGPGHAPAPGRHTGQRAQQEAGLVRTVSIFILLLKTACCILLLSLLTKSCPRDRAERRVV